MAVSHQSRIRLPTRPHSPSSTQIPPVVTGRLNLPGSPGSTGCAARCRLLGAAPDCVDPHHARCGGRHPLESQATDESLLFAPDLERGRTAQTRRLERFFARVFSLFGVFRLQRPPLCGWSAVATQVALVYPATVVVGLATQHANRPDLIRSPRRVLAYTWEGLLL